MGQTQLDVVKKHLGEAIPGILRSLGGDKEFADRLIQGALISYMDNRKLAEAANANPMSFVMAVKAAADAGLDIGGARQHGALVPYKGVVIFIPQYQGYIHLMTTGKSSIVASVVAHIVHAKDHLVYRETLSETIFEHEASREEDPGPVVGAYAIARLKAGGGVVEYMRIDELEAARRRSPAKDAGPWVTDTEAMYRKTPIRRLRKYLPLSSRVEKVFELEDQAERGLVQGGIIEAAITAEPVAKPPASPANSGVSDGAPEAERLPDPAPRDMPPPSEPPPPPPPAEEAPPPAEPPAPAKRTEKQKALLTQISKKLAEMDFVERELVRSQHPDFDFSSPPNEKDLQAYLFDCVKVLSARAGGQKGGE